ncbi:IS5 family transposase [Streptomyces sp. NPDC019890]|uniref:IS5 family transposase n=1 Tax=Streptomyces sp. NPDC019890 TaxID=3365064 RepID=UPI00384EBADD
MPLTDAQWARIEPLLPDRTPRRGGRWRDHRQVIDAIAWKFQTGSQWVHPPAEYGSWKGVYTRLRKWAINGTWGRVFTALLTQADAEGELDWVVAVDSTIVRAHQHAAGARIKGPRPASPPTRPCHRALPRWAGHQGSLGGGWALSAAVPRPHAWRAGDAPAFEHVMAGLRVPREVGRPRTRPVKVLADRAYSSRAIREHLRSRGIRAVIPQPADRIANRKRKGRRGGRPPGFDCEAYKQRNTVERCINCLKNWRGLATRYEKTATIFKAGLHIAGIFIWSAR